MPAGSPVRLRSQVESIAVTEAEPDTGMTGLRVAVLAPISWRVPPRHYGPWEQFASLLTEGLVASGRRRDAVREPLTR